MALIPGQTLADSENDQNARRPLRFHPVSGNIPVNQSKGKFRQLGEFASNLAFNVVDSALFGVPSSRMRKDAELVKPAFGVPATLSYGETWDRLGIKPWEELQGLSKLGMGIGQAAGFFIPFSGISKGATALQRMKFSNFSERVSEAVSASVKGVNHNGVNSLESIVQNALRKQKGTMPHIYRATPEQYASYSNTITENLKLATRKAFEQPIKGGRMSVDQADGIAANIVGRLEKFGNEKKYIDNLPDMIASLGLREGAGNVSPYVYGYLGRAVDQGANMAMFDFLGRLARKHAGEPVEGMDDIPLAQSLSHSAGFAAAIAFGDFIPGGRRAGMFKDFYKFARHNLGAKRSFAELHKSGKVSEDHLRTMAAYFGTLANSAPKGMTAQRLNAGAGKIDDVVKWLDRTYANNKKDLLSAIMKDGGKSLVGSLPRAGVDALITASYMGMSGEAIINDEAMIGDYLVGAFMAMRAHQPLNPRHAMRWRYNTSIDAKFNFMENMGADVSVLKSSIPYMERGVQQMDLISKNLEHAVGYEEIYNALFGHEKAYNYLHDDGATGNMKERAFLNDLSIMFSSSLLRDGDKKAYTNIDQIMEGVERGDLPDFYRMTDAEVMDVWDKVSQIRTYNEKTISEYANFDRFLEDFQVPIVNYHVNATLGTARNFAELIGVLKDDTISDQDVGMITVRSFDSISNRDLPDGVNYMMEMLGTLNHLRTSDGKVRLKVEEGGDRVNAETLMRNIEANKDQIEALVQKYHDDVATMMDSSFNFSSMDNPSFAFLQRHSDLVNKNRLADAIKGTSRSDDPKQNSLIDRLNQIFDGHNVSTRIRYEINRPLTKEGTVKEDLSATETAKLEQAQKLLDEIVSLKIAAGNVDGRSGPAVKIIDYADGVNLVDAVLSSGMAYRAGDNFIYGNTSHQGLMSDMRTRDYLDSGLSDTDYIALRVLQSTISDGSGRMELIKDQRVIQQMIRGHLTDDGKTTVSDDVVNEYADNYLGVVDRLSRTGKVHEKAGVIEMTPQERQKTLEAIELIHEVYNNKLKADAESMINFTEALNDKFSKVVDDMTNLQTKRNKGQITAEEVANNVEKMVEDMQSDIDAASRIIPRAEEVFSEIIKEVEEARDKSSYGESFQKNLFSKFDEIGRISEYLSEVQTLSNLERSIDGWSTANLALRSKILSALRDKGEFKDDGQNLIELIREYNTTQPNYEVAKGFIQAIRESTMAEFGISRSSIDYNSDINVNSLREVLDQMTANHKRTVNLQSFIQRLSDLGLNKYIKDNTRLSDEFVRKITDQDNFAQNVRDITNEIKNVSENFEIIKEDVAQEMASAMFSVIGRNHSRKVTTIENDRIVIRHEDNIPYILSEKYADGLRELGISVDNIKNQYISDSGHVLRFTDEVGGKAPTYDSIQKTLTKSYKRKDDRTTAEEQSLREGDVVETVTDISLRKNQEGFMTRPILVDIKASDDLGFVVDLTPQNAAKILEKFDVFTTRMMEGATDGQKETWDKVTSRIRESLKELSREEGTRATELAENDFRGAIRAMFYGEHFGKDFFLETVGNNVDQMLNNQARVFKYVHHIDNTNVMSFDARIENHFADIMEIVSGSREFKAVAKEARRRATEGVRVAVYNDDSNTVSSTLRDVLSRTLVGKYQHLIDSGEMTRTDIDNMIENAYENTRNEVYGDKSKPSISIDAPLNDGSIYASGNSMRHDVVGMGGRFDFYEGANGREWGGARAAKIAMHSAVDGKNLLAKHASRYDPSASRMLDELGIDYLIPTSSAKVLTGKNNVKALQSYDILKNAEENMSSIGITKDDVKHYPPETVKYMFSGHGVEDVSRSNASVTHYWNHQALVDYSKKLNVDNSVQKIVSNVMAFKEDAATYDLGKLLIRKYNEIKTSADYSHLGVIEQFLQWGIKSNHSLVRQQVMRHVRDMALSDVASKNNAHVSNTFLFSDNNLSSPVFNNNGRMLRFGELNLSYAKENVQIDGDVGIIFSNRNGLKYNDAYVTLDSGTMKLQKSSNETDINANNLPHIRKIFEHARNNEFTYGQLHELLTDLNRFTKAIQEGKSTKTMEASVHGFGKELATIAKALADANITDFAISANTHKIPKKFGPDSVVNRVRGFADKEKGNINELNNYEISMQHQADQDGDKITVYLNNPYEAMKSSIHNSALGREATVYPKGEGEYSLSPNLYNFFTSDMTTSRQSPQEINNLNENTTLAYTSQERKSKFVVGSVVKMQGVMTMLNNMGVRHLGDDMRSIIPGEEPTQFARDYHHVTGVITQSVLDAWKGVNPSLLNIRAVKDFILFGETPSVRGVALDLSKDAAFQRWHQEGGLFGKKIDSLYPDNPSAVKAHRDIVRQYMNVIERAYSVFGDSYDGGARMKPSFDTLHSVYRDLQRVENNDYTSIYRTLRAKYSRRSTAQSDIEGLDHVIYKRDRQQSKERMVPILSISEKQKPSEFYPQLVALKRFVTDDRGRIRTTMIDSFDSVNRADPITAKLFPEREVFNVPHDSEEAKLVSDLFPDNNQITRMKEMMKEFFENNQKDSKKQPNIAAPKMIGVYERVLQNQIVSLHKRKNFYRNINDFESARDLEHDITYYTNKLNDIQSSIKQMQADHIDTGKAFTFKGGWFNNNMENTVYAYKVGKDGSFEFSGYINPKGSRELFGNHVILRNPINLVDSDNVQFAEGLAFANATDNALGSFKTAGMNDVAVNSYNTQLRSIIEQTKAEIRKADSEAYDFIKRQPGSKNDAFDDARMYIDMMFNSMTERISELNSRFNVKDHTHLFDGISKSLLSPRVVGNHYKKDDSGVYMPYFKLDNKFTTHLTRYLKDFETNGFNSELLSGIGRIFNNVLNDSNRQGGVVGDPRTSNFGFNTNSRLKEYELFKNNPRTLFNSIQRLAGRDHQTYVAYRGVLSDQSALRQDGKLEYRIKYDKKDDNRKCILGK